MGAGNEAATRLVPMLLRAVVLSWVQPYLASFGNATPEDSGVGRAVALAGFPPRRPRFEPRSGRVGFVVHKAALGQVSSE
jgi:hypothetical protein